MPSRQSKRGDYVYYLVGFPRGSEIQERIEEDAHQRRYRWAATYIAQLIEDLYAGRLSPELQPLITDLLQQQGELFQNTPVQESYQQSQGTVPIRERQESVAQRATQEFSGTLSEDQIRHAVVDEDRNVDAFLDNL